MRGLNNRAGLEDMYVCMEGKEFYGKSVLI